MLNVHDDDEICMRAYEAATRSSFPSTLQVCAGATGNKWPPEESSISPGHRGDLPPADPVVSVLPIGRGRRLMDRFPVSPSAKLALKEAPLAPPPARAALPTAGVKPANYTAQWATSRRNTPTPGVRLRPGVSIPSTTRAGQTSGSDLGGTPQPFPHQWPSSSDQPPAGVWRVCVSADSAGVRRRPSLP